MVIEFLLGILLGAILGVGLYFAIRAARRKILARSLATALFLVKIPKESPSETKPEKDFKAEITRFEQLLGNLASIKKPFAFEIAVPHVGEEIHFYVSVPRVHSETAVKQIQGLWNGASVEPALDDYNVFNAHGVSAAAYLSLKENGALPIRTYGEIGSDTFSSIAGAFTKVSEIGEGAAVQIVVRPAPNARKRVYGHIEALRKGESLKKVFGHEFPLNLSDVGHALNPKKAEEERRERVVDEDAVKALEAKISKPVFEANVRLVASAATPFQANDLLEGLAAGFNQFASPRRNEFKVVKSRNSEKLIRQFIFRVFEPGRAMLLNSEEISSFYHFPTSTTETPKIKWLKSKEAPPPANIPSQGTLLGESVFRGQRKPVRITDDDRRRHVYVIGQTGTGKSTLLGNMIIEDIKKGKGVAVIDPHGELVENALGHVPKERLDDLICFDPGDLMHPLGLNMLDYNFDRPEEKTFIVNEMINIFDKLYDLKTTGGPMFEQYTRNALLLLMEDMPNEPATLMEVPRIFTDPAYRLRKLERITNPIVVDFWEKEATKAGGEASLANMTPYITSKFNNFIANDYMRPIIGQAKSAFNFRQVMDEGKILLINLSKGRIGDINAGLLGMVFTGKILMSALSRVDIADSSKRRDFNLYIDEFQNFTTDSISTILSEARKYRLNLTMAHQFIAQLTEKIRDAVFGNVGSQAVFRVGVQDAEFLVKQFEPTFSENDLINIDNLNAYVKILINGETSKPFNVEIGKESWAPGNRELAEKLKEYSREKYGQDRQEIEEEIYRRLRE